eukprot:m.108132 g.108132  ORF g.108132 m.108132 type:complete len:281 (-) comp19079_c0_seq1:1769-2611(-)
MFLRLAARTLRSPLRRTAAFSPAVVQHLHASRRALPWAAATATAVVGAATATVAATAFVVSSEEPGFLDPIGHVLHPWSLPPGDITAEQKQTLTLIGAGTRTVTFVLFKVYSVGLYLDEEQARRAVRGVRPSDDSNAAQLTPAFLQRLLAPEVPRALRVVPVRPAAFTHLRDGFARALETRLTSKCMANPPALSDAQRDAVLAEIAEFKRLFPRGTLAQGQSMHLYVHGTTLYLEHKGETSSMQSPFICATLFECYMDDKPVSTNANASFVQGIKEKIAN